MPTGTLEIEVPDVGIVEFPSDTKQEDIEAILNRTYGPKATPQVPEFKSPIELPAVTPGEKSLYEEPTWFDEPTVKLGDFLIKGPHEAKTPVEEGINKTLREGINSLTSPRNLSYMLGSMGVAATGQAARALVSALWTGAMGANAIENAPQLYGRLGEEMAKPPEKRDKELLGELGTQAFIDTGFFAAPAVGLKRVLTETPKIIPTTPEVPSAEAIRSDTGQVPQERVEPERVQDTSGENLQQPAPGPPAETPQGQIPLTPEQQAVEQARLAKELEAAPESPEVMWSSGESGLGKTMYLSNRRADAEAYAMGRPVKQYSITAEHPFDPETSSNTKLVALFDKLGGIYEAPMNPRFIKAAKESGFDSVVGGEKGYGGESKWIVVFDKSGVSEIAPKPPEPPVVEPVKAEPPPVAKAQEEVTTTGAEPPRPTPRQALEEYQAGQREDSDLIRRQSELTQQMLNDKDATSKAGKSRYAKAKEEWNAAAQRRIEIETRRRQIQVLAKQAQAPIQPKTPPIQTATEKAQSEVSKVAATEGVRPAKEVKSDIVSELQKALSEAKSERELLKDVTVKMQIGVDTKYKAVMGDVPVMEIKRDHPEFQRHYLEALNTHVPKVTIEIPGDGTFTVFNTKEALGTLLERAKKISTVAEPVKISRTGISKSDKEWVAQQLAAQHKQQLSGPSTPAGAQPISNARDRIRAKQDQIIAYAERTGMDLDTPISGEQVGAPTVRELKQNIYPDFESSIDSFLREFLAGPGTPSAAQPPDPKAAIEALEESFRNIKGPKPSLQEQVTKAFNVGQKAARAKDAVSSALQGLKSSGDYLIDKWKGAPKIDDMVRAKGELSRAIETRGWRVRKTVQTILKAMPTERQRAAVLKWVDAGGDAETLRRGAVETKPEFRQAYEDALKLKGDELVAGQNIRNYFDERLDDAVNAGVLEEGVENYIRRFYERDPKAQKQALAYVQSGLLQQNPGLIKKRVFQFDWEAEKAGYRPVQDFLPRVTTYEAELTRAIAARTFVRQMVGYEEGGKRLPGMKAPDGRPVVDVAGLGVPVEDAAGVREATLIKPSFKPGDEVDPKNNRRDYVERDYPALRKWRWTTLDAGGKPIFVQGNLLIHPDFVGRVDALLEPSRVRYGRYPKLGRAALGLSSTVKQTMLDLSGFHQVQITVHGMEHKVMPWNIVKDVDFQNPNMDGLLKGGLTLGGEYYSAHHGEGLVGSALTRHIPILGPLMESYHNWLFQSYIPRIKTTMALAALERNRARYKGKLTEEQIYTKTSNEANSAFGELNYIMLERSKTTQDIARLIMLAPDFLEARARFAGGAFEKGGKLGGQEQRAALLLGAMTMYVTARILNKLTDDKYHFEPENAFSLVHNGHAYSLRTVQGDILHLLEEPLQFWMNRLNPVFGRTILEVASGRDTFGRKRSVPEALWDSAKNVMPIALRTSQERKLWESLMNSMGVTARRWNDVDKAFTLAKDWKKEHGIQERGEFIYDPEKDPLRGLKIALSRGDDAGAALEIKKVLASKVYTREKLNAYFDRYATMPFTGSRANDKKWLQTLTDDQRAIVEGARQHKLTIRNLYRQSRAKYDDLMNTPLP